jgi:RNA polymerase sigma-70 factor, ECF subfamily
MPLRPRTPRSKPCSGPGDLPRLREVERFDAWLYRLVVNACYTESRRERAWDHRIRLIDTDRTSTPDESTHLADRDELERGFGRLSVEQRAVIVLRYYAGFSLTEVAEMLGIPIGTARSRHHYALRQLRAFLEADARRTQDRDLIA